MEAFLLAFKHWGDVDGRSRPGEFWVFTIVEYAMLIFVRVVVAVLREAPRGSVFMTIVAVIALFLCVVGVIMIIPGLTLSVRRLHDVGKSGWWLLIKITGIGGLLLLYWYLQPSQPGDNQYGPEPQVEDYI